MHWLLLIAVIGGVASLLMPLARGRKDRVNLGSVSNSWIDEHRGHHQPPQ
jgi:hypothetical protein